MKKKLDGFAKEQIIKTTLLLIDDNGGASNVDLREIARKVGCSAPNIYNYFNSLDDLLNTALVRICEDFKDTIQEKTLKTNNTEELILLAFTTFIEYAIDHPGRLNFYHFEKMKITIVSEAEESAISVGNSMADLLDLGTDHSIPPDKIKAICNHIHLYVLGELSEYITGRRKIENKKEYVDNLVAYCKRLFEILIENF